MVSFQKEPDCGGCHPGEGVSSYQECNSKKEAEEAARRMLAENAKHFSAQHSVEASVVSELDWYEDAREAAKE